MKLRWNGNRLILFLAVVTGLCSGLSAVALKKMISLLGSFVAGWYCGGHIGLALLLFPGVGMLVSLLLVRFWIKDDISHGVTKVLQAVSRNESKIKAHNIWSSMLTSAITIGFGGSVGAEAPIVYTGAAIGSNIGRKLGLSYRSITILLGSGAAGAIAGIFGAPMAGVLFTLEILLFNISMTSIIPLLLSSVTAAAVSYFFTGGMAMFTNTLMPFKFGNIPYYVLLGIACGFVSLYFVRTTLWVEDRLKTVKSASLRWLFCSVCLGGLIFLFPPLFGEGYYSLEMLLNGEVEQAMLAPSFFPVTGKWGVLLFFFLIMFLKVFAMSFTNAGGGVGGTFGPTLIVGGIAGFVFSRFINLTGFYSVPEVNFTLVGMAGLMAGVMQAPLTAIFLIAEMTGGYGLLFPLIITASVSFATIRFFEEYSIYSKRLAKSGELLTHDSDMAVLTLLKTSELIETDFVAVNMEDTLGALVKAVSATRRNLFPILDAEGTFQGYISLNDIRDIMFDKEQYDDVYVYQLMKMAPDIVRENERMDSVMKKFESTGAWNLPVLDEKDHYLGFVSKSKIFSSYREQLKLVSQE